MPDTASTRLDWDKIDALKFADESEAARALAGKIGFSDEDRAEARREAIDLVKRARVSTKVAGLMESFLQEFGLSNKEGLALMCLAEALLRVPDAETVDKLIAERISSGEWGGHIGKSEHWLVNASTLGLMLTGSVVGVDREAKKNPGIYMKRLTQRLGEPVIRAATMQAMKILGEQFVLGRTIKEAIKRGHKTDGRLHSFDMLGEGARTHADAARYHSRYLEAIATVGKNRGDGPIELVDGVSVKLSALHPRYHAVKAKSVFEELYPLVLEQAEAAKAQNIGLCLDAEETDRLVISLKILERLAREPSLAGWDGLGLAIQAYQKRCAAVIEMIIALGRETGRRFLVRLVKGAYWDTEIKFAQQMGWPDFPVWSTKPATDLNYLACAKLMLTAPDTIYSQFATHNAFTLCAVRLLAQKAGVEHYEFQRLHGMGEPLYKAAQDAYGGHPVRIYAPVGSHEDLLPYLVRRLLENGANTSFVHSFLDKGVPAEDVASGPFDQADIIDRHPFIPMPPRLYGEQRVNSAGVDLSQALVRGRLARAQAELDEKLPLAAGPIVNGKMYENEPFKHASPINQHEIVSIISNADDEMIETAFEAAEDAHRRWDKLGGPARAEILRAMGDALEADTDRLIAIMTREGGKTLADGVAEVREAVDFCRYYANEAETKFAGPVRLPGPAGETNHLELHGRGVFVCISPWNFPLAIFTGQLAAALAAGNAVVAKPAEQTPLIACEAVKLFQNAGLPKDVLHLITGDGRAGAALVNDPRTGGVCFTGSTEVARIINKSLSEKDGPIVPFIAETGGLNGMFVDTSALKEQVIDDAIISAFGSAGQRCSALRILFLPEDTAQSFIDGLMGAMDALALGDPADAFTDVGPVIDEEAKGVLDQHMTRMRVNAKVLKQANPGPLAADGFYFAPALIELPSLDLMEREVFGPILHIVRYKRKDVGKLARELAAKGYGLTLGIHSRLSRFHEEIMDAVPAGNVYVNRNITGAVVGVQPFGGEGLSGTGPKAGGPNYVTRFAAERTITVNISAQGGDPELLSL
ncbi:bifunctional proline dehydrogenase/L-glutamate gamma-semialdehyde dehydrogenase PutA [Hyphobacterium sp. CCMP332]|uniref:bifunctional proline dehydrogenase/L-glutamate gamma-semialdehyde dehydrogenase PutA n=1 Tax=Hyphobacterium sp. CCMP332 TaxID=2749086 RepID=UPI00165021DD|nr:bifunctional proline dehydrogenase/L-glutamate gamma-semialdehyde dehydrogenase PutA [Hyphobacterium sp. CCMP332]QNL19469.1 bifunctional proline dehydrogenase/L-glutamate gamma-semialdehyde dehydrogenase PutA [Hyphobacterium sp. CCMP332]